VKHSRVFSCACLRLAAGGFLIISMLPVQSLRARVREVPKARVIVLTDISNEPDDEESMVRFLIYSNEYDVEGLIATTSTWLRDTTRADLIARQIIAYGKVRRNLLKHAKGYPSVSHLLSVLKTGQPGYGMAAVGPGKSSAGSNHIIKVVDKPDPRPVWVAVWGGVNTLAQALWDVKHSRPPGELRKFVAKLRVYTIADQDDSGYWLRRNFPDLFYIVSPTNVVECREYYRCTWTGISGDRHFKNGPFFHFELVDNPWLTENIIENHGPLGKLYPKLAFIMEGDTPSFLNLIKNGLGSRVSPTYGGWGGRYKLCRAYGETRPIYTNSRDCVRTEDGSLHCTDQATIWRWREAFQYDFAARMDWCVAENYSDANHNPVAVINGYPGKGILELEAAAGETIKLSAAGSSDPDGDRIEISWFQYPEAGTYHGLVKLSAKHEVETSFVAPRVKRKRTLHIILQLKDSGRPNLYSYRRAIITLKP